MFKNIVRLVLVLLTLCTEAFTRKPVKAAAQHGAARTSLATAGKGLDATADRQLASFFSLTSGDGQRSAACRACLYECERPNATEMSAKAIERSSSSLIPRAIAVASSVLPARAKP